MLPFGKQQEMLGFLGVGLCGGSSCATRAGNFSMCDSTSRGNLMNRGCKHAEAFFQH
jgi:hypothetical protein